MKNNLITIGKGLLGVILGFVFFKYVFVFLIIWGLIEAIIVAIKNKHCTIIRDFICNFVITVLTCIDILLNIVLQVPANRILLTTTLDAKYTFGNPKETFTKVLSMSFIYQNLRPRGLVLYKIITLIKN